MQELVHKYRPQKLDEVIGQETIIKALKAKIKAKALPHAVLLSGPSGVGKTTIARILAKRVGCSDMDIQEINCADSKGIDTIRDIRQVIGLAPMGGESKSWILDECHQLTAMAMDSSLKPIEEPPSFVWFFLCTTNPDKLTTTLRGRCTLFQLKPLTDIHIKALLDKVTYAEGITLDSDVYSSLVESSNGCARKVLTDLDKIRLLKTSQEQIDSISAPDTEKRAYDLAKLLMWGRPDWEKVRSLIVEIEGTGDLEDPERFRHMVLSCAKKEMLKKGSKLAARAYMILREFESAWYECPKSGLVMCCWAVVNG